MYFVFDKDSAHSEYVNDKNTTEEITEINGHIVHRIKALKTFKNKTYGTERCGNKMG